MILRIEVYRNEFDDKPENVYWQPFLNSWFQGMSRDFLQANPQGHIKISVAPTVQRPANEK